MIFYDKLSWALLKWVPLVWVMLCYEKNDFYDEVGRDGFISDMMIYVTVCCEKSYAWFVGMGLVSL